MFINVVITRVILFCPAVPPSPPSAPSLVPRNATSFVSLLAKLLVLRARLSLSAQKRERESERKREGEREKECSVPSRECPFLFMFSLALRPFYPFFLSPPFSLSLIEQYAPLFPSASHTAIPLFFSLTLSLSLFRSLLSRSSRCYRSRVSLLGLTHFPPLLLGTERRFFSSFSSWFSYSASSFSFSSTRPLILPRVAPFPPEFAPEYLSPSRPPPPSQPPPPSSPAAASRCSRYFSLFPRPFLSLSIAVFCTLRI